MEYLMPVDATTDGTYLEFRASSGESCRIRVENIVIDLRLGGHCTQALEDWCRERQAEALRHQAPARATA